MPEYETLENGNLRITLPITLRNLRSRKLIIFPDQEAEIIADNGESLLVNLARAFRWQAMIEEGTYQNAAELAKATVSAR